VEVDALREELARRLEPYKIPTGWQLYSRFPRTDGLKPDRSKLRESETADGGLIALHAVAAHRLSSAVILAQELGIFDRVADRPATAVEIARDLGLHTEATRALVEILSAVHLLRAEPDETLSCVAGSRLSGTLIDLERVLRETILSVDALASTIRAGSGSSDRSPALPEAYLAAYSAAMRQGARLAALHILRTRGLPAGPVIDIGFPAGALAELLFKRDPQRELRIISLAPAIHLDPIEIGVGSTGLLFMFNALRRVVGPRGVLTLDTLHAALKDDGMLVVCDVFCDTAGADTWLKRSFCLDWLQHGALHLMTLEGLCRALAEAGFRTFQKQRLGPLLDVVIAGRSIRSEG
jgi:hypothetical protein